MCREKEVGRNKDLRAVKRILVCCLIVFVFVIIDKAVVGLIENYKYREDVKTRAEVISTDIIYEIETVSFEDKKLNVSGLIAWENAEWENVALVLKDSNLEETIVDVEKLTKQQELNGYFENMKCFEFEVTLNLDDVKADVCYEILLDVSYKTTDGYGNVIRPGVKVSTHQYLYNGASHAYNPLEFEEPDIAMEEWQNILKNGRLCDYSMEHGTWIYLYEGTLYWIIDSGKIPPLEKVPSIPTMMYTNRGELVPEEQLERYEKSGYTYIEIYLNEGHYLDKENSVYFVVSYELPVEYPITYIRTGPYGNRDGIGWIYKASFRISTFDEMLEWD